MASARTSKPDSSATNFANPRAFDKLYWIRVGLGGVGGATAAYTLGSDFSAGVFQGYNAMSNGLLVAMIFYIISYYLAKYVLYRDVPRESVGKLYSTGIGGFSFLFVFAWVLLFTLASASA